MPPLTSASADDWLKLALAWQCRTWLEFHQQEKLCEWLDSFQCRPCGSWTFETPQICLQTSLMWKPGSPITPHLTLRPPVFPPSLPFLGPNGFGDGLYFAPQKHIVFFSTAGYSICKGLADEVLRISITALVSMLLPLEEEQLWAIDSWSCPVPAVVHIKALKTPTITMMHYLQERSL